MTRMAQERDSILCVRAKVDSYDELEEANIGADENGRTSESPKDMDEHIKLCSPRKAHWMSLLAENVSCEISITGFTSKLAKFLKASSGADIMENRLKVCSVCVSPAHFNWDPANPSFQIRRYLSLRAKYVCFMSAAFKYDYL